MGISFLRFVWATAVIVGFFIPESAEAQQFDYQKYPALSVDITHLTLNMEINPDQKSLNGRAVYQLNTRISGMDSLVMHAAHMEINRVQVNNREAEYELQNDSLFIVLSDSAGSGEEFEVSIAYSTLPQFGILINESGTVWTSHLPKTTRHWLPVIDHPRVTFTSRMHFIVPAGYEIAASGVKVQEEVAGMEQVEYTFESKKAVPASALSFAAGNFEIHETSYGIKNIRLATEDNLINSRAQKELLKKAYQILKETEEYLELEFPFEQLNIILIKDHHWESKAWGASTLFLYSNRTNTEAQLRRGIYSQWYGIHHREEQWREAEGFPLVQTALHFELVDEAMTVAEDDLPGVSTSTIYEVYGISSWNNWQNHYRDSLALNWRRTLSNSLKSMVLWEEGVYSFADYAEYWYEQSGQPRFEIPAFNREELISAVDDTVRYRVDYHFNTKADTLNLKFSSEKGIVEELVSASLITITAGQSDTVEVMFTGSSDSAAVPVSLQLETAYLENVSGKNLIFDEYKPASFLLYEIDNAESIARKAEAARKLGSHTENPDIQLAIRDVMDQNLNPRVQSALLESLAKITNGAKGTEEIFLNAAKSDSSEVRMTALSALQNYPGNEDAVTYLRTAALQADSLSAFQNITKIYNSIADSSGFKDFVNNIVQSDTAGYKAIFAIQQLANRGAVKRAVKQAEFYISEVYDYGVRASALNMLMQHDGAAENWHSRAENLLVDMDPRIRYLTVRSLSKITGLDYRTILQKYQQDEYDARVHRHMQELLQTE